MKQNIKQIFQRILPPALLLLTVCRILIGLRIPYWILADQFYDDRMMYENALNIVNGAWLGAYDSYALTKGISYPLFMILGKKLCIPYSLMLAMLNVAATYLLTAAVSEVIGNKYVRAVMYVLLLFSPINLTLFVTQRLYRMAIIPSMVEIVFAGMIGLTVRKNAPLKRQLPWSLLAGVSLAFFWQIREDSIWILPFVAVLTLINVCYLLFICVEKAKLWRILFAVLPLVLLFVGNVGVAAINHRQYGVFVTNDRTEGSFGELMSLLYKLDGAEVPEDVWISKDVIYRAEEASATLRQVKSLLDESMENWANGEEIKGDHYSWLIRGAVQDAGYAADAVMAEQFYKKVVAELEASIDAGKLTLKKDDAIYFSSQAKGVLPEEIPQFLADALANIWEIAGYSECALDGSAKSTGKSQDIRRMEAFNAVQGIYGDYYHFSAKGQIFLKSEEAKLSCILKTAEGEALQGIILQDGMDAEGVYVFDVTQDYQYDTEYLLEISLNGDYYTTLEFADYEDEMLTLRVESFTNERIFDYNEVYSSGMVSLANKMNGCYQLLGKPCFVAALICFILLTGYVINGLLRHQYEYLELWIIITGVILSAVLLRFGNSIFTAWFTEDMQKFINSFYSCGVYMLLQIFKYLSIAAFVGIIGKAVRKKKQ